MAGGTTGAGDEAEPGVFVGVDFLSSQPIEAARKAATQARLRNFFMEINPFNKCGKTNTTNNVTNYAVSDTESTVSERLHASLAIT